MRWPAKRSKIFRISSRSRKQYRKTDIAPRSMACVPSQTKCEEMRCSSTIITRMYCARFGNFEAEQLFDRQAINQVVAKRIQVIHAVGERDGLRIGLVFAGFLDAGVQVAEVRNRFDDGFAVQFQRHAQHAVRGRVLRPHVEDHRFRLRQWPFRPWS